MKEKFIVESRSLLHFANMKCISKMQVLGDSKIVIDWANKKVTIENIKLGHILQEIQRTLQAFQWTVFMHVYCELNQKANELSKEALTMQPSSFLFL